MEVCIFCKVEDDSVFDGICHECDYIYSYQLSISKKKMPADTSTQELFNNAADETQKIVNEKKKISRLQRPHFIDGTP
jgi:hypothetical protein